MGNSMCKSQNPGRSRNQFEELFSGCTNFCACPSGISSNRNHHWKKQVIETRPPYLGSHTTSTKWHQATTLTSNQPLKQQLDKPPVPPPRKKRVMKKARSYEDVLDIQFNKKAGFKDVFGEPVSLERQTTSTSHNHIYDLENQDTRSTSSSCGNSLKIGNKKTDKFFGENLSDSLSNEPYHEEGILSRTVGNDKDELDVFVENNVQKVEQRGLAADKISAEERLSDNLDKKAAFLMTMLDSYDEKSKNVTSEEDDDERYRGMVPVEEEIIVPKKKITRCICDETDHLLHHLRHDECKNHGVSKIEEEAAELKKLIEKKDAATETPPVKPKRDLTLYHKSLETSESMPDSLDRTPSPPLRRKKSLNNSKEGLSEKVLSVAATVESEPKPIQVERSESPNSILTKDLMDQIVKHAFPHDLDIEDMQHDGYIDGSTAVSEKISKLKDRKISLNRKISTDSSHSNQSNLTSHELPSSPGPFSSGEGKTFLGCRDVTISPLSFKEEPIRADVTRKSVTPEKETKPMKKPVFVEHEPRFQKASSPVNETEHFENTASNVNQERSHLLQDDGVNMLEELIRHQQFNTTEDVINEIYKNQSNIVYEFQRFLEDELNKDEVSAKLEAIKDKDKVLTTKNHPEETIENQSIELVSNSTGSETSSEASTIKNLSDTESDTVLQNFSSSSPFRRQSVNELETWFAPNDGDFPNISETHLELISNSSSSDDASTIRALSISDPEDEDQIPELLRNNHLMKAKKENHTLENRRESIEDVDIWFTQHLDLPHTNLSQSLVNEDAKKADFLTYDGVKLYPFGQPRERQMSLTDEFFTTQGHQQKQKSANDEKSVKRSNSESY